MRKISSASYTKSVLLNIEESHVKIIYLSEEKQSDKTTHWEKGLSNSRSCLMKIAYDENQIYTVFWGEHNSDSSDHNGKS
jgi:hypothetical protein